MSKLYVAWTPVYNAYHVYFATPLGRLIQANPEPHASREDAHAYLRDEWDRTAEDHFGNLDDTVSGEDD